MRIFLDFWPITAAATVLVVTLIALARVRAQDYRRIEANTEHNAAMQARAEQINHADQAREPKVTTVLARDYRRHVGPDLFSRHVRGVRTVERTPQGDTQLFPPPEHRNPPPPKPIKIQVQPKPITSDVIQLHAMIESKDLQIEQLQEALQTAQAAHKATKAALRTANTVIDDGLRAEAAEHTADILAYLKAAGEPMQRRALAIELDYDPDGSGFARRLMEALNWGLIHSIQWTPPEESDSQTIYYLQGMDLSHYGYGKPVDPDPIEDGTRDRLLDTIEGKTLGRALAGLHIGPEDPDPITYEPMNLNQAMAEVAEIDRARSKDRYEFLQPPPSSSSTLLSQVETALDRAEANQKARHQAGHAKIPDMSEDNETETKAFCITCDAIDELQQPGDECLNIDCGAPLDSIEVSDCPDPQPNLCDHEDHHFGYQVHLSEPELG